METTYNSNRKSLIFPEYGRHIQKMVDMAVSIKDNEERKRAANAIINTMGRMNPNLKDVDDYQHKLWDHLIILSGFKLNVDSPFGNPKVSDTIITPKHIDYKDSDIRYKQYGRILFKMIEEADNCKNDDEKQSLALIVANHIKKSLFIWNGNNVDDNMVLDTMSTLSNGRLTLPANTRLVDMRPNNTHQRRKGTRKKGK